MTEFLPEPPLATTVASVRALERLVDVLCAVGGPGPLIKVLDDPDRRAWNLENALPDAEASKNPILDAAWHRLPFPTGEDKAPVHRSSRRPACAAVYDSFAHPPLAAHMTRPESEVIKMSNGSAGTQGWFSCEPLSKRRMGVPGPDPDNPRDGSPLYYALKVRQAGRHKGYRSLWEWEDAAGSWMLLVLDDRRNIVGQVIGRTQEACSRRMNALFAAKGLGVYDGKYADHASTATPQAA